MGSHALFDEARVRDEVENGTDGLKRIAERHGISRTTLYNRAKAGGWKRKHAPVRRPASSRAELRKLRLEAAKRVLNESIVGRGSPLGWFFTPVHRALSISLED